MTDVEYATYEVTVRALASSSAFSKKGLRPRRTAGSARLDVIVPTDRLAAGDCLLTLSGERPGSPAEPVTQLLIHIVTPPASR